MASPAPLEPDAPLAELLRHVPFFAGLPSETDDCFALIRQGVVEFVDTAAPTTRAGSAPDLVFLLGGALERRTLTVERIGPGEHYGEVELIAGRPAAADVVAAEPSVVFRIPGRLFDRVMTDCHVIGRRMLRDIAQRLASRTHAPARIPEGEAP
jgi:CRP-like cAMP-binding protein